MKDSTLKIILFAVIIIFGSLMLLFDIPVFYLLIGAVILGVLVLFLAGGLRLPRLEREKSPKEKATAQESAPKKAKEKKPPKEKKAKSPGKKSSAGDFFSSLKGAFAVLGRDFSRKRKSKTEIEAQEKKIDTLLDQSIQGGAVASLDDIIPDAAPAEKKKTSDPFSALVGEDLNADLLNEIQGAEDFSVLDDTGLDVNTGIAGKTMNAGEGDLSNLDVTLSGDNDTIILDETNDADEVKEILEAHSGELALDQDEGVNLAEDAMEGLEGLDLEEMNLEEGQGAPAPLKPAAPGEHAVKPSAVSPPGKSEPSKPSAPAFSPEQDMLSFSKGRGQDDDLMASLRADAKSQKKNEYASLIRDLKDTRVAASDLQSELESLLRPKRPKSD
ncbi:MAG: hypothetical protein A4E40_00349 [Methanoregulaceae archaeon PtaU1.Bin059]|nr:MAG: hypothetical protein A4E39_00670 [Methanoregulaceae archaeon PtaB.Bin152]OPY42667.1 MAG: hypothetical protein A4E40_00349 [Methanoregulaceae archaeon PtaU1.Bin059]